MATALVSVLIPAYNVQKYLGRCLRSVLKQTYQNLEIVVVDDGSTDQTYAVAQKYAAQDSRIVLLQKPNQGNIALTRNFLLEHCHGEYLVWVDSDDCLKPRYVEKLYQALTSQAADMSVCYYAVRAFPWPILPPLHSRIRVFNQDQIVPQMVYQRLIRFMLWNKMYRTALINGDEPVRFDPNYRYGEDLLFNLQYIQRCQKVACVNHRLYRYSWRHGSEMHKKFSENHVKFVEQLMTLCETDPNPATRTALRGWAAFSCCGFVFLADKRRYADSVAEMQRFAYQNRANLYKNHLANIGLKFILWLGLKTWCRPRTRESKKGN